MAEGDKAADTNIVQPVIPPVAVTLVGTGDGAPMANGQVVNTPDHQANLVVQVVTPLMAIIIRFANAYLTALVGLLIGGPTTGLIPASDFWHLIVVSSGLALAGPIVGAIKDVITILTGLERKYPIETGNV